MNITMADCRRSLMCRSGVQKFLETHGLDYQEFRKNGLPEEVLAATGDAMALKIIQEKHDGR